MAWIVFWVLNFYLFLGYSKAIQPLPVVKPNQAIRLKAVLDHEADGIERLAGDLWQLEGPLTYHPTSYSVRNPEAIGAKFIEMLIAVDLVLIYLHAYTQRLWTL